MSANVLRHDDITIIELGLNYDSLNGPIFEDVQAVMLEQAQNATPPLIVLDLADTVYMGSAFIETISRTWKRVNARSGQLVLCCLTPFCAEVLRATRLDTLWKHYPTRDEAIAALVQAAA